MSHDFPHQSNPTQRPHLAVASLRDSVDASIPVFMTGCFSDDDNDE